MGIVQVCDDLVDFINGRPTEWPVAASKQYIHTFDRKNLPDDHLSVFVISPDMAFDPENRSGNRTTYSVFVVFQQRIAEKSPEVIDPLISLTEEISYAITASPATEADQIYFGDAQVYGNATLEIYQGHLEQYKQFAAALAIELKTITVEE